MWHWILDHVNAFNAIGLAWGVPVLLVLVAARFFRPGHYRGTAELVPVRAEEQRDETDQPRSAA
ncbi:MAG TPA: hypothetical protein VGR79_11405 [Stellaceae bacterium]|nr:hypothetical protein [Stellaceae bacterium]